MLSHPGRVRKGNEDACAASPEAGIFVVCDGMGGAAAGEVASHLAAETLLTHLLGPLRSPTPAAAPPLRRSASTPPSRPPTTPSSRRRATPPSSPAWAPRSSPFSTSSRRPRPIPSTPTSCPRQFHRLWLAHVGDSRCYLYRDRELSQLTADHSLVEEQLRAGQITAAEAARSPMRNFITRAVGSQSSVDADIQGLRPHPGDIYLLASDGLNRELSDADIATVLADIPSPPTEPYLNAACQSLITAANQHGGRDNITVLLVAFPHGIERRKLRRPDPDPTP